MKHWARVNHVVLMFSVLVLMVGFPAIGLGQVSHQINYQGYLTDYMGNPMDGDYSMTFAIYSVAAGGSALWTETQTVSVDGGVYNVVLGQPGNEIDPADMNEELFIGVSVESDDEMIPRQPITATVFALRTAVADDAGTLDGMAATDFAASGHNHTFSELTGAATDAQIPDTITVDHAATAGDADTLDGSHASAFAAAAHSHDSRYYTESELNLSGGGGQVHWDNLTSVPPGFADGIDNNSGGDITGVTAGVGLDGGGTSGTVTLSIENPLSLTNSIYYGAPISGNNTYSSTGYGIVGNASGTSGRGVYGIATGTGGTAVYGDASYTGDGVNFGGQFSSNGLHGFGVFGSANNDGIGANYGGFFRAKGYSGRGVHGEATSTMDGTNYGGRFIANGSGGRGVYGEATSTTGLYVNYGGYFSAAAVEGRGVYAYASGYYGRGVYGRATGAGGVAVYGYGNSYDFYAAGPGTNYGSASSIRWKQNIQEIEGALEMVMQMRGIYFDWDEEHGGQHDIGFIAEEVGVHVPEIVVYEEDSEYANGMDYSKITPMLLQAIKEQQGLISDLRVEIETLRAEIKTIKSGR